MKNNIVKVGDVILGGGRKVVVQTMCNTPTQNVDLTVGQCRELSLAGAEIIRVTTQGIKEVEALSSIKKRLLEQNIRTPVVADVHFNSDVAIAAARIADKVRINPGNFAKDPETARKEFARLVRVCSDYGTPLRIGINHGSLGKEITEKYGNTPNGMKEAAVEWMEMAESLGFNQFVISLKSSNTVVMVNAYRLLYDYFKERGVSWPLHLGVTEAGNGDYGRIKSSVGLAALLKDGIGDTVRVSLTENPLNEIPVAQFIADYFHDGKNGREISIGIDESGRKIAKKHYRCHDWQQFILSASCDLGPMLLDREVDDIDISAEFPELHPGRSIDMFRADLLQATRRKFSRPEYIACPGCGRTLFNLEAVFEQVKRQTSHLKGYCIAVMGCVVNGPGEMADADYGYVGEGKNRVSIYRGKEVVYRGVPENEAINKLLRLVEEDARNRDGHPNS